MSEKERQALIGMIRGFLRETDAVTVLTGAGVSAESGIPTFRDAQTGLWAKYDPMELATPQAFARRSGPGEPLVRRTASQECRL